MSYKLTASIWQEGDKFVSLCPELGVSSFGNDPEKALTMLQEAVELYLINAKELEILEKPLVPSGLAETKSSVT